MQTGCYGILFLKRYLWYNSRDDTTLNWDLDNFHVQKFDFTLIQASMVYCANVIGTLFYLLMKILNLITFFSLFLVFLIPNFFIFLWSSGFSWYLFLYCAFISALLIRSYHDISSNYLPFLFWVMTIFPFLACKSFSCFADNRSFFSSYCHYSGLL